MQLELTTLRCLCSTDVFRINGEDAYEWNFGHGFDASPGSAEPYGCGDRVWQRYPLSTQPAGFLESLGITPEEYDEVCGELENALSWGTCGWCV